MATPKAFELPSALTVAHAAELRERLLPLRKRRVLILDGAGVQQVGSAGLQLLVALIRDRGERPTQWNATSQALINAAEHAGLTQVLNLQTRPETTA